MSWLSGLFAAGSDPSDASLQRQAEWAAALEGNRLPGFVRTRLGDAAAGKTPWLSTMTPAELMLARSHGIRPLATVSGTCWFHYGYSWTRGHSAGWHAALDRMRQEALAVGANAVVDVKMRTIRLGAEDSMDFTVFGTAVKLLGLPPSTDPVIATVPALEFVRLLEMGIVPAGIAVGAHYEWLNPSGIVDGGNSFRNQPLTALGQFWEQVRRVALRELREDTKRLGTGVLAHTHFGQLLRREAGEKLPPKYLGRHIVIGTVVSTRPRETVRHSIRTVVDMRDELSPLRLERPHGHTSYASNDEDEII